MTVIATRPRPVSPPAADLRPPSRRHARVRRILREILRYVIATVVVVVLGQLMTPVEARAAAAAHAEAPRGAELYGSNVAEPARS